MWKWIGLFVGLVFKGPLGAVFGLVAGWWLDNTIRHTIGGGFNFWSNANQAQTIFQQALFGAMGHLAKADGRVSQHEIAVAETVMRQLHLNSSQKRAAMENFNAGKQSDYPLEQELERFAQLTRQQPHLRRLFVEILLNGALADGTITRSEHTIMERVAHSLGMSSEVLAQLIGQRHSRHRPQQQTASTPDDYKVLGVSRKASNSEIKRAYRKLMSQYHPDKMVGKDVPATMREYAYDKVREVRAAYDSIRKQRNFR